MLSSRDLAVAIFRARAQQLTTDLLESQPMNTLAAIKKSLQRTHLALVALAALGIQTGCTTEVPADDDDDGTSSSGESSSSGGPSGSSSSGGNTPTVVGAWWTKTPNIEVGWTLCEDGRMYGFSEIGGYAFLDKGTWSGTTDVTISWRSKDTTIGDEYATETATFGFDNLEDTLCCFDKTLMIRLEGEVTNADCDPAW